VNNNNGSMSKWNYKNFIISCGGGVVDWAASYEKLKKINLNIHNNIHNNIDSNVNNHKKILKIYL
jgi:glutathione peroxidase-family protein